MKRFQPVIPAVSVLLWAAVAVPLAAQSSREQNDGVPKSAERPESNAGNTDDGESTGASRSSIARSPAFLRLTNDSNGQPESLQTSVVRYVPVERKPNRLSVDLIGAVHVGERSYYEELNALFQEYDVVLYELVAPQGTRIPKGGGNRPADNPIAMIHGATKSLLNLESQIELVDYSQPNFVHADMSPADMAAQMKENGDTPVTIALDLLATSLRQANRQSERQQAAGELPPLAELNMLALLFDPRRDLTLKRMMAEQFVETGVLETGLGKTLNRMLISDRNEAAMNVLAAELKKDHKRIAIFYGAAHLPDLERRLFEDFGMKRKRERWMTAWNLKADPSQQPPVDPLLEMFRLLDDASGTD